MNRNNSKEGFKSENYNRRLVIDVDGTICHEKIEDMEYSELEPKSDVVLKLKEYKQQGFIIVLHTSRQMRTYGNNINNIISNTLPVLIEWLKKHDIPYDEIHVGKPWCGFEGFYVDDKTIRPDEFVSMSYGQIREKLNI